MMWHNAKTDPPKRNGQYAPEDRRETMYKELAERVLSVAR